MAPKGSVLKTKLLFDSCYADPFADSLRILQEASRRPHCVCCIARGLDLAPGPKKMNGRLAPPKLTSRMGRAARHGQGKCGQRGGGGPVRWHGMHGGMGQLHKVQSQGICLTVEARAASSRRPKPAGCRQTHPSKEDWTRLGYPGRWRAGAHCAWGRRTEDAH